MEIEWIMKSYFKMNLVQKAKEFARECHKGQFRNDGKTPYITHPEAVVNLLLDATIRDENIIASAWLHDVMEDCNININEIKKEFGDDVAEIINVLTRNVDREKYKQRIKESDFAVKMIKLADTIHNCSEMYESSVSANTRTSKINDCNNFYFDLAIQTYKPFYFLLKENIK